MIAYLDMPSGISGDMFLGCLISAGWPIEQLQQTISTLPIPADSWSVHQSTVQRGPLVAMLVHVEVVEQRKHRHLRHIRKIIEKADLPESVQKKSIDVFTKLAEAEAHVHGQSIEAVHFHEVGALDAIIDIVGSVAGLHHLGVSQLYASGLPLAEGWTKSEHGLIPLPAPATLNLLTAANAPTRPAPGRGELVTPTGAALVATLANFSQPSMTLGRVGIGTGQKDFEWPNIARLWLSSTKSESKPKPADLLPPNADSCVLLETNIDDMNPEFFGAVRQQLFDAGALDVWTTAIQMKKERPGVMLSILAPTALEDALAELLLRETTTLGVRVVPMRRHMAAREIRSIETVYGTVRVKVKRVADVLCGAKPEYEDCLRLANEQGVSVQLIWSAAQSAAHGHFLVDGQAVGPAKPLT